MFKFTGVVGGLITIEDSGGHSVNIGEGKRELLLDQDSARELKQAIITGLFVIAEWERQNDRLREQEKEEV